ncbi:MAG: helix-turn-helix transcriptional regulator [Sideroxyarcus sp.]|nr:helix-turn-helix transcriptional regulator [Sideroxyarcus sp.]
MNVFNFDFTNQRETSTAVDTNAKVTRKKAMRNDCSEPGAPLSASDSFSLTDHESEQFLGLIAKCTRIERHYELFELLQGAEVQHFIPHQILISAWGHSSRPGLEFDVISAIPGVRTGLLNCSAINDLVNYLYRRWLLEGRQTLLFSSPLDVKLARSTCKCALHKYLQGNWSLMVHAVINARDGTDCIYLALNASSIINGHGVERFRLLADPLITQIDVAFRRIAALTCPAITANQGAPSNFRVLSARENEILLWVSEGKTNGEIAQILAISSFTVKNHVQQIMNKLNAANRTEAVEKYRQIGLLPGIDKTGKEAANDRNAPLYA